MVYLPWLHSSTADISVGSGLPRALAWMLAEKKPGPEGKASAPELRATAVAAAPASKPCSGTIRVAFMALRSEPTFFQTFGVLAVFSAVVGCVISHDFRPANRAGWRMTPDPAMLVHLCGVQEWSHA